jgi:hypothetical protein
MTHFTRERELRPRRRWKTGSVYEHDPSDGNLKR